MGLLKRFISGFSKGRDKPLLSPAFSDLLQVKRTAVEVRKALEDECRGREAEYQGLVQVVVERARAAAWDAAEVTKLQIYMDYFFNRVAEAYTGIAKNRYYETDVDLLVMACVALYQNDQFEDAAKLLRIRKPDDPEYLRHLDFMAIAGFIIAASGGDLKEALRYFDLGLQTGELAKSLAINSSFLYFEAGELEKMDYVCRVMRLSEPDDPQVKYVLGCLELAKGYYAEGFRLCEARYDHPEISRYMNTRLLSKPRWQQELDAVAGKRLLIHAEQGLGDNVMCARYLPQLRELGAQIVMECQEAAKPLFEENYPYVEIIPLHQNRAENHPFDLWVGAMSLPYLFRSTAMDLPGQDGYLRAPQEHLAHWTERITEYSAPGRLRVGLAWSGNKAHRSDRRRSVPVALYRKYVNETLAVDYFSLQTEVAPEMGAVVHDLSEELASLGDTAALIELMDLVITVDTSVVHLAGALGKRTWLLLPYRYEWRWNLEGEDNPWYASVKVLRQSSNGDWDGLLEQVFNERLPAFIHQLEVENHVVD